MSFPDSHRDLLDAEYATLGTIDDGGYPQLTEIWFLHSDGRLRISLNTSRAKTRHLQRRPQCSLLILDVSNPLRYLEVRGRARVEPDGAYEFADAVGAKYGVDLREYDQPGAERVVVTIEPEKVNAVDMSSS